MSTDPDFEHFCNLMRARSGLVLNPTKAYLVQSRLTPVARDNGLAGVPELLAKLRTQPNETLVERCVEAMATHESFFFRDGGPFEQLAKEVLPALIPARQQTKQIRIWCAACSSGQEPYSVAIVLKELAARMPGWSLEILATDISKPILERARTGVYSAFEARRGLSPERLSRWFKEVDGDFVVSEDLRSMVTFRHHNLLQGTGNLGVFDVIFCRNVLIYFDVDRKRDILASLNRVMAPDGALFLGSSETVLGLTDRFQAAPGGRGHHRVVPQKLSA